MRAFYSSSVKLIWMASMLSGGADSSILLWDLENADNMAKRCTHRPVAAVNK